MLSWGDSCGVGLIEADAESVCSTSGTLSALFWTDQAVLTELRTLTEQER